MLNDIADTLAAQNGLFLLGLGLAIGVFGFLLAQVLLPRFARPLHKAGFAVWLSVFYLIGAMGYVFLRGVYSAEGGIPGLAGKIYMGGYGVALVLGFGVGLAARGRSISICGRGGFAFLALIPGVNAVFGAWKPNALFLQENPPKWYLNALGMGAASVLTLGATAIINPALLEIGGFGYSADYDADEAELEAQEIAAQIARSGLGDTLWSFASDLAGGYYVEDDVFLIDVNSTETRLQYLLEVTNETGTPDAVWKPEFIAEICADPSHRVFLEAGAEIRSTWLRPDRSEIGDIIVILKDCAAVVDVPGAEISAENSAQSPQY
ncbi:MAG: hypothetical protein V3U96_12000 [Paracoccaceae bacterium]